MRKYLYGIIYTPKHNEGDIELVSYQDLSAVVKNDSPDLSEISRKNLLDYEKTLENLGKAYAPFLPASFGTIARNEEFIKNDLLKKNYPLLMNSLDFFKNKIVIDITTHWKNIQPILAEIVKRNRTIKNFKQRGDTLSIDETITVGKIVQEEIEREKQYFQDNFLSYLKKHYVDHKTHPTYNDETIFHLSLLIDKTKLKKFNHKTEDFFSENKTNIISSYSGPLPIFDFFHLPINIDQ